MSVKPVKYVKPTELTPSEFRQYKVICAALYCYYHKDEISYSNMRGLALKKAFQQPPPIVPGSLDCSAFVTYCFAVAGCRDPNGAAYNGGISTATLWTNGTFIGGPNVKFTQLDAGDLIFYMHDGPPHGGNYEHVALYVDEAMVVSMGSQEGPSLLNWDKSDKPVYGARRYVF
jgi:cell wall-associated NlpC family hydrolase